MKRPWLLGVGIGGVIVLCAMWAAVYRASSPRTSSPGPVDGGSRVVSLAPSLTEVVQALGGAEQLVGVTRFCPDVDPAVRRIGGLQVDYEAVVALKPERVLAITTATQRPGLELLARYDIEVEVFPAESIADVRAIVTRLGEILGASARATALLAEFDRALAPPTEAPAERPTVAFVVHWGPPHFVAAGGSFVHEMIVAAGGENVFGDDPRPYRTLDVEGILERNPSVIVDVSLTGGTPGHWADLTHLAAVREGRVFPFSDVRPGPGIPRWVAELRAILHGRRP